MLSYAAKTDVGNRRDNNEDCYLASPELSLWVMADGVGGHDAGEIASKIACDVIKSKVEEGQALAGAIDDAHQAIKSSSEQGVGRPGMATTVVVLLVKDNLYQIAWVGDSRGYLWRDKNLLQLTHDQSLVQRLLDENLITQEEAYHHPRRNLVTQALGQDSLNNVEVEVVEGEFKDGDKIILCSDGLTDYIRDTQITQLLIDNNDESVLVNELVSAALGTEGKDNITVMAIKHSAQEMNNTQSILTKLMTYVRAWLQKKS